MFIRMKTFLKGVQACVLVKSKQSQGRDVIDGFDTDGENGEGKSMYLKCLHAIGSIDFLLIFRANRLGNLRYGPTDKRLL